MTTKVVLGVLLGVGTAGALVLTPALDSADVGATVQSVGTATATERYRAHNVNATIFWVGEEASTDNAGIPNTSTEWDSNAGKRLGGVDDPRKRTAEGLPSTFTPKHNPFYIALPASEFDDHGVIAGARRASPWANEHASEDKSLFKGRWVKITRGSKVVYAQWLDTGPSDNGEQVNDYKYVFGVMRPKNTFGLRAGIDLSPATALKLDINLDVGQANVAWRFIDAKDVPKGIWTKYPAIDNATHWD